MGNGENGGIYVVIKDIARPDGELTPVLTIDDTISQSNYRLVGAEALVLAGSLTTVGR